MLIFATTLQYAFFNSRNIYYEKEIFLFAALILSLSVGTINATSEVQEIVMTDLSVDNMSEARAFLANYYVTTESDVALSNHPSTSGYPAYRYNIMSQDVSGTIYGSSTGFIVEEDGNWNLEFNWTINGLIANW